MEQATEPIPPHHPPSRHEDHRFARSQRRHLPQRAMRPVGVVMIGILTQHRHQVPTSNDEHPVQALAADRAHPALRVGIRPRRPHPAETGVLATCAVERASIRRSRCSWRSAHPHAAATPPSRAARNEACAQSAIAAGSIILVSLHACRAPNRSACKPRSQRRVRPGRVPSERKARMSMRLRFSGGRRHRARFPDRWRRRAGPGRRAAPGTTGRRPRSRPRRKRRRR